MRTNYYFDVDGVLADFHNAYDATNRKACTTYNFIRNLVPFFANIALVKALIADGNNVYISTMVANEDCKKARIEWLNEFLPEIPNDRIIVLFKGRKCDNMLTEDGVLVDDKKANCNQWVKAGHKAVYLETKGGTINL